MTLNPTTKLTSLKPEEFAVVDLDTGTMLGINLKIVPLGILSLRETEQISSSDSAAFDHAQQYGDDLLVDEGFLATYDAE